MPWASIASIVVAAVLAVLVATPQGRRQLASAAAITAGWMLYVLFRVAPTIAVVFADGLVTSFERNRALWAQVVAVFVRELTGQTLDAGQLESLGKGGALAQAAPAIFGPLVDAVVEIVAPMGALTPERGAENLNRIFSTTMALGLQGWWISAVGDLVSLGKFGSAADLPDAVERGLGLSRIGRLVWRGAIKKSVTEPLDELYNRRYTFKKLSLGEARDAWHRGIIDDAAFLDYALAAGFSPDRAAALLKSAQTPYPLDVIRSFDRLTPVSETLLLDLLAEHGFTGGRGVAVLDILRRRDEETILRELAAQARRLYGSGRITQVQLTSMLREAHFPDSEISMILAIEDLIRAESKTLTVGEIQAAVRDGALDPPQARSRLRQLGYQDQDIDLLIHLRGKEPSAGQVIDAVARGRITQQEGITRLEREGYSPQDAQLLVSLRGRRLTEGQILDALRAGIINAQTARADLIAQDIPPDAVDILLGFIRRELSPADVQAAISRGILTPEQALERLTAAGYSAADAQIIIALRRRLLLPGEVLDAFEAGFISRVDALGDLQARGFTPEDALLVVRVFELRVASRQAAAERRAAAEQARQARPPAPSGRRRGTGGTSPALPPP